MGGVTEQKSGVHLKLHQESLLLYNLQFWQWRESVSLRMWYNRKKYCEDNQESWNYRIYRDAENRQHDSGYNGM